MGEKARSAVIGIDLGGDGGIAVVGNDPAHAQRCRLLEIFGMRSSGKQRTTSQAYQEKLRELIRRHGVVEMAAEQPGTWGWRSVVASQRQWWALAEAVSYEFHIPLRGYEARSIKKRAAGGARASKADMLRAARLHLPTLQTSHDGVADACCIAWLLWNDRRVEGIRTSQGALLDVPRQPRRRQRRRR